MSWSGWTWLSLAVLVVGAPAVFLWFLRDARALLASLGRPGPPRDDPKRGTGDARGGAPSERPVEHGAGGEAGPRNSPPDNG